jgi:hypothetical protein
VFKFFFAAAAAVGEELKLHHNILPLSEQCEKLFRREIMKFCP